jgi:hypothetical protein
VAGPSPTGRSSRRARTGPNRWKNGILNLRLERSRRLIGTDTKRTFFPKIEHRFQEIGKVLKGSDIMQENVYNMDETGLMSSNLRSVEVLVGQHDRRYYRGARVERQMVTAVECISADGEYLSFADSDEAQKFFENSRI